MVIYKWIKGKVPEDICIKQVYGIVFNEQGSILLRIEDGKYKLTGGKTENFDENIEDTLKREFMEEVNTSIKNIYLLGYQLVDECNGVKPYAQIRMIAQVDKMYENRPDLDNGKLYKRIFKTPEEAKELLNWGKIGREQIDDAVALAKRKGIINMEDKEMQAIKTLWNYMKMDQKLVKADCIIGLGSSDIKVANISADLYLKGYYDKIIFSGGLGKITNKLWKETEAEKFTKVAIQKGVPREKIYLEKESTNTGDNFRFTKKLIECKNLNIKSCIIVCKPYDEKRVYATFKKLMPEYEGIIYSEDITCEEYYKKNSKEWIDVMVGDVQRMNLFYKKGWQIKMDIPKEVNNAYEFLVKIGYDKFILEENI